VSFNGKGLSGARGLSVETLSIAAVQRSAWIFDTNVETPAESFGVVERLLRDLGAGRATIAEQLSGWGGNTTGSGRQRNAAETAVIAQLVGTSGRAAVSAAEPQGGRRGHRGKPPENPQCHDGVGGPSWQRPENNLPHPLPTPKSVSRQLAPTVGIAGYVRVQHAYRP
jgi:hypothetical protein